VELATAPEAIPLANAHRASTSLTGLAGTDATVSVAEGWSSNLLHTLTIPNVDPDWLPEAEVDIYKKVNSAGPCGAGTRDFCRNLQYQYARTLRYIPI
jgi:hypothetical protein